MIFNKYIYVVLIIFIYCSNALGNELSTIKYTQSHSKFNEFGNNDITRFEKTEGEITQINYNSIIINNIEFYFYKSPPLPSNEDRIFFTGDSVVIYTLFNKVYYLEYKNKTNPADLISTSENNNTDQSKNEEQNENIDFQNKKLNNTSNIINKNDSEDTKEREVVDNLLKFDLADYQSHPLKITTSWRLPKNVIPSEYVWFILRNGKVYKSSVNDKNSFDISENLISYENNAKIIKNRGYSYQLIGKNKKLNIVNYVSEIVEVNSEGENVTSIQHVSLTQSDLSKIKGLETKNLMSELRNYLKDNNSMVNNFICDDPRYFNSLLTIHYYGFTVEKSDLQKIYGKQIITIGDLPLFSHVSSAEKNVYKTIMQLLNHKNKRLNNTTFDNGKINMVLYNKNDYKSVYIENKTENKQRESNFISNNILKGSNVKFKFLDKNCIAPTWNLPKQYDRHDIIWIIMRNGEVYDKFLGKSDEKSFKIENNTITYVNNFRLFESKIFEYQIIGKQNGKIKYISDIFKIENYNIFNCNHEFISCIIREKFTKNELNKSIYPKNKYHNISYWEQDYITNKKIYHKYIIKLSVNNNMLYIEYPFMYYKNKKVKYIADLDIWPNNKKEQKIVTSLLQIINCDNNILKDTTIKRGRIKTIFKMEE